MCDLTRLADCFAPDDLEWRAQRAGKKNGKVWVMCVAYVTNRAIQARLDEVCTPAGWRNEYQPGPQGGVICGLSIYCAVPAVGPDGEVAVTYQWVTKWDGADNTQVEGVKGGLSAAMKRAAVQWGIGRYLYQLDAGFGNVSTSGANFGKLPPDDGGDRYKWDPPQLPGWAIPPKPKGNGKPAQDRGKPSDTKNMDQSQDREDTPPPTGNGTKAPASDRQIEALRELAIDQAVPAQVRAKIAERLQALADGTQGITQGAAGGMIGKARKLAAAVAA